MMFLGYLLNFMREPFYSCSRRIVIANRYYSVIMLPLFRLKVLSSSKAIFESKPSLSMFDDTATHPNVFE